MTKKELITRIMESTYKAGCKVSEEWYQTEEYKNATKCGKRTLENYLRMIEDGEVAAYWVARKMCLPKMGRRVY